MKAPKTNLLWTLLMPEDAEEQARRWARNEEDTQSNLRYMRWRVETRLERYPLEQQQTLDTTNWLGKPFVFDDYDGEAIHLHLFLDKVDHSFERIDAAIRMGEKITLPYNVIILDDKYDPITLRLVIEWPEQASQAKPLLEQARCIVAGRDWAEFVLEQCRKMARGVGPICTDCPGKLLVYVGRKHEESEELFGTYAPADFATQLEADLQASIERLKDVTSLAVDAEVYFESEPTEFEHIAYGLSYDDYQRRSRRVGDKQEFDVEPQEKS